MAPQGQGLPVPRLPMTPKRRKVRAVSLSEADWLGWVADTALALDCHVVWWEGPTGLQPILWVLPGDRFYDAKADQEMPRLRGLN